MQKFGPSLGLVGSALVGALISESPVTFAHLAFNVALIAGVVGSVVAVADDYGRWRWKVVERAAAVAVAAAGLSAVAQLVHMLQSSS
ncbi:MAG TPA: hypothetical protein PKB03_00035 [Baekduia sp.]|nr:hypothetical protein [Baekduia sp.]